MESLNTNSVSNIASSVPEDDEILVKPNFVPFYCITLALIFFHALRVKEYKTNIDSSRVVNALFCFSILTVISFLIFIDIINPKFMPTIMLTTLIGGAYIMVLLLYIIEKIQPLSLVVIGIYSAVFYHFLYNDKSFFTVAAFTLTCYALGALALIKKKHFSYLVGYIFGGMTILLLESEDIQQQIWTLIWLSNPRMRRICYIHNYTNSIKTNFYCRYSNGNISRVYHLLDFYVLKIRNKWISE